MAFAEFLESRFSFRPRYIAFLQRRDLVSSWLFTVALAYARGFIPGFDKANPAAEIAVLILLIAAHVASYICRTRLAERMGKKAYPSPKNYPGSLIYTVPLSGWNDCGFRRVDGKDVGMSWIRGCQLLYSTEGVEWGNAILGVGSSYKGNWRACG